MSDTKSSRDELILAEDYALCRSQRASKNTTITGTRTRIVPQLVLQPQPHVLYSMWVSVRAKRCASMPP